MVGRPSGGMTGGRPGTTVELFIAAVVVLFVARVVLKLVGFAFKVAVVVAVGLALTGGLPELVGSIP